MPPKKVNNTSPATLIATSPTKKRGRPTQSKADDVDKTNGKTNGKSYCKNNKIIRVPKYSNKTKDQLLQEIHQLKLQMQQQQTSHTQRSTTQHTRSNSNITSREIRITDKEGNSRSEIITTQQTNAVIESFIQEEISSFTETKIRPAFEGKNPIHQSPILHMLENRLQHAREQGSLLEYRPGSFTSEWGKEQLLLANDKDKQEQYGVLTFHSPFETIQKISMEPTMESTMELTLTQATMESTMETDEKGEPSQHQEPQQEPQQQQQQPPQETEPNDSTNITVNNSSAFIKDEQQSPTEYSKQCQEKSIKESQNHIDVDLSDDVVCVTEDNDIRPWKKQVEHFKALVDQKKQIQKQQKQSQPQPQQPRQPQQPQQKQSQPTKESEMLQINRDEDEGEDEEDDEEDDDEDDDDEEELEFLLNQSGRTSQNQPKTLRDVLANIKQKRKQKTKKVRNKKQIVQEKEEELQEEKQKESINYPMITVPDDEEEEDKKEQQEKENQSNTITSLQPVIETVQYYQSSVNNNGLLNNSLNNGLNNGNMIPISKRIITTNGVIIAITTPEEEQIDREQYHNQFAKPTPAGPGYYFTYDPQCQTYLTTEEIQLLKDGIKLNYPIFRGLNTFAEDYRLHGKREKPSNSSDFVIHTGCTQLVSWNAVQMFHKRHKQYFNQNHFDPKWTYAYYQPITVDQLVEMVLIRYVARMNGYETPLIDEEEFYEAFPILSVEVDTKEESHNNTDEIMSTKFGGVQHIVPQSCMKLIPLSGIFASIPAYDDKEENDQEKTTSGSSCRSTHNATNNANNNNNNGTYLKAYKNSDNIKIMQSNPNIVTSKPHEQFCEEEFYIRVNYRVPNYCPVFKLNHILRSKYATLKTMQNKGINVDKSIQELKREYKTECLEESFYEKVPNYGTITSALVLDLTAIAALLKYISYVEYKKKTKQKRLTLVAYQNDINDIHEQVQKLERGLIQAREIRYREIQKDFKQDFGEMQNKLVKAHLDHLKKEKPLHGRMKEGEDGMMEMTEGDLYDPVTKRIHYDYTQDRVARDYLLHNKMYNYEI